MKTRRPQTRRDIETVETRIRTLMRRLTEAESSVEETPAMALLDETRRVLKASEDRYQRVVSRSGAVVCEMLPDGTVLSLNEAITKVTGYRPQELIDSRWWETLFPGELRKGMWRLYRRLQKGDVTGYRLSLLSRHRTTVTVELSTANSYTGNRLEQITAFAIDVTGQQIAERDLERTRHELEEKVWERTDQLERINAELQIEIIEREQFERALAKSEERFRRAVANIPAMVLIYDPERRIRLVNARTLSQWGLSEREVLGSQDEELLPRAVTDTYLSALKRALRTRRMQGTEATFDMHGRAFTFLFNYVPLLNADGDIDEVLGIAYDITERRQIEEDLRLRHRELQTLNRISEIALTCRSLGEAYRSIAQAIQEATGFPSVAVETWDPSRQRLICQASLGWGDLPRERPLDDAARQVFDTRQPLTARCPEQESWCVTVPMVVREQAIGILGVGHLPHEVDERTVQLLAVTANYVAVMTDRQRAEDALRESEAQRERAEELSLLMVARMDLNGRWTRVPQRMCEWLGYSEQELLGYRSVEITHPDDREATEDAHRRMRRGESVSMDLEKRYVGKQGQVLWAYVNASVIPDASGRPLHYLVYLRDITEQKRAEEELRLAARVFESSAEAIMILDPQHRIVNINRAFGDTTGFDADQVVGQALHLFDSRRHEAEFFPQLWERVDRNGQWQGELWGRRRGGEEFPALLNMGAVRDDQGRVINYVGIFRDITEIKRSQEQLERLANYDDLTGLPNRNLFYDRLRHGIDRARRARARLAVLFVDLDNFKVINDTLGHDVGDRLLEQVAGRLARSVRSEDTVARLGGDEFIVLLEDLDDIDNVADTARRINESLFIPMDLAGQAVDITGSIGISIFPEDGEEMGLLLKNADTAMYVAKDEGRNKYRFFTQGMNQKAVERLSMESSLRRAVERDEFFLVYQPQLDLHTGKPIGMEAAIRWNHPERGVIGPTTFIPIAEATGAIDAIGRWVLEAVCRQIRDWSAAGVERRRVAVNISACQFKQRDFADQVIEIVRQYAVDPRDIELELTESAIMQDPEEAEKSLKKLKAFGLCIAIDDFGTGYSSLSYIKRFPIDRLKIDSSFVHDVAIDANDAAISAAIIVMAHSLEVSVVAEGVETREQLDFLTAKGCDEVQGYLFSHPLAPEELLRFYA